MNEVELTPELEAEIRRVAHHDKRGEVAVQLLRYYVQFGPDAPAIPKPSRQGRRWLRRLNRIPD